MNKVFLVGIGGIGMSALARYYLAQNIAVFGSDSTPSTLTQELAAEGATIYDSHSGKNLPADLDLLIYSEAVEDTNPERDEARERAITEKSYFAALGEIAKNYTTIAVAGTHGKSTTTAMLALAMEKAGLDPTVFVGTKIFEWQDKNFRLGKSPYLVVEACEYRNSFWHFKPKVAVLTSLEAEHLDFFETEENYLAAFKKFLTNAEILVADYSDEAIRKVSRDFSGIKYNTGQFVSQVPKLQIPGRHNVLNATKVFSVFTALDWDLKPAQKALADYQGSWRRSEYKGTKDDIEVYDDYAHHPTEVAATLTAFRAKYPERRIIAVFQPHQYSRTHQFLTQFAQSFKHADLVLIPEIYKVRDRTEDLAKVSGQDLVEKINNLQQEKASFTFDYSQTVTELHNLVSPGDLVLTMGAGPVNQVAEGFLGH